MKSKLVKLIKKPFIRNVFIVATGTAAAQAITMALSPAITRLYGPEAFGLLGVFTAVVGIISPVAALTYPIAIVLPKSDTEAKGLVRLSIYISFIFALLVSIFIMCFKEEVVNLFNIEDIAPFLYFIPLVVIFSGFVQVTEQWLIRTKQYSVTARVTFLQAIILNGSKVGLGFVNPVAAVLVTLNVFGQLLKPLMMIITLNYSNNKRKLLNIKNNHSVSTKELAMKYKDFPIYRAPQTFIDSVTQSLPTLLLTSFFGTASVGYYSIGKTLLSMPTSLIGKSVGDVFYPRISEASQKGESLTKLITKATVLLGSIGFIPYGIVVIFGPSLFSFIFGSEWIRAGEYASWIALWSFSSFILRPSLNALPVLSAQALHLRFTVFSLIIRIMALFVGYYIFSSDLVAVALFGLSSGILNLILILVTLHLSKRYDKL